MSVTIFAVATRTTVCKIIATFLQNLRRGSQRILLATSVFGNSEIAHGPAHDRLNGGRLGCGAESSPDHVCSITGGKDDCSEQDQNNSFYVHLCSPKLRASIAS